MVTVVRVLAALLGAVLGVAGVTHEIGADSTFYRPEGVRAAVGDTVSWAATGGHPLAFDGEAGGPYTDGTHSREMTAEGAVAFHCTVHGGPGGSGMSGLVTVGNANLAPSTNLLVETTRPRTGQVIYLIARAGDPERIRLRHEWDLDGDGTYERATATGDTTAAFSEPGRVTVRLRVTDDLGLTAVEARELTVTGAPVPPPAPAAPGRWRERRRRDGLRRRPHGADRPGAAAGARDPRARCGVSGLRVVLHRGRAGERPPRAARRGPARRPGERIAARRARDAPYGCGWARPPGGGCRGGCASRSSSGTPRATSARSGGRCTAAG